MLKTAQEVSGQMRAAKGSLTPFQIDPVTRVEVWIRSLTTLAFFGLFVTAPSAISMGFRKGFPYFAVSALCVLTIIFAFTYNEYWEIDPSKKQIRAMSNWMGMKNCPTTVNFSEIASVAVSGHHHSRSSSGSTGSSRWWEYGLAIHSRDGALHRLFPNLSKDFKDVWGAAEALADLVEAPLLDPVPMAELEVATTSGISELRYQSGGSRALFGSQPTVKTEPSTLTVAVSGRPEKPDPVDPTVESESPLAPRETESSEVGLVTSLDEEASPSEPVQRLELVQDYGAGGQAGCAVIGLLFVAPFLFMSLGFLATGDVLGKMFGVVMGLGAAAAIYWLLGMVLSPVTKKVTYVDPAGEIGSEQFRARGKPTRTEVAVPPGSKVVLREAPERDRLAWALSVRSGSSWVWIFDVPKSREEGEETGRKISQTLGIPFEVNSDFER